MKKTEEITENEKEKQKKLCMDALRGVDLNKVGLFSSDVCFRVNTEMIH